jgi:hypothetical protein
MVQSNNKSNIQQATFMEFCSQRPDIEFNLPHVQVRSVHIRERPSTRQ